MFVHFDSLKFRSDRVQSLRILTCFVMAWFTNVAVADEQKEPEEFFETSVRPLLVEKCLECHGPDEQAGLLRLDQRPDLERAAGAGPILVPGDTAKSLLLRAVGYNDSSLQMPPDGKLTDQEIAVLSQWVEGGAYWPDEPTDSLEGEQPLPPAERIDSLRESHWAYRPVEAVEPPSVANAAWTQQPIDYFVLSKLEQAGLAPNPAADRRTLMLRAYFTLIGLPPTYQEVQEFIADDSEDAFSQLIDRLLESLHYGERWARHWLDLARFAETTGYLAGSVDTTYPYAYTYRDYVIKAFNSDKPFDRFIVEQLAADQLHLEGKDRDALAALGFLTVGRKFMNRTHDIIDDRIDVVTRGFLAQSVTCARCHDHKYDPIPIADYYSLYGVFASSHEPAELPLLGNPEESPLYPEYLAARAEKQQEVDDWLEKKRLATEEELRSRVADYLVYIAQLKTAGEGERVEEKGRRGVLRPPAIQRWQEHLEQYANQQQPVWGVWHHFASINKEDFSAAVEQVLMTASAGASGTIESTSWNIELLDLLRQKPPTSMIELAELVGGYLESIFQKWQEQRQADPSATRLAEDVAEAARQLLFAGNSPTTLDTAQILVHLDQAERNAYNQQLSKIKAVESKHPGAPGKAMVLVDNDQPHEPVIFLRGQPGNRGDQVPRRFLQVLSHVDGGRHFSQGSGRLELAQAIANPKNPLTTRVIVNRVWQQHFGVGLVRTSSDFGSRGEVPSHPELLDYLASEFMADGWSLKRLQRRIMLASVWQQSSQTRPDAMQVDPENRLLWRQARRRLEFEPLRDRVLMVSGQLDGSIGGRSVAIHQDAVRRGLYAYVDREDVPSLLASFDVPSPDASQAIRSRTTVPQQALFILNSQFIHQQASSLSQWTLESTEGKPVETAADEPQSPGLSDASVRNRITALYRRAIARDPDEDELLLAEDFIRRSRDSMPSGLDGSPFQAQENEVIESVWQYGFGYWDAATGRVQFNPMPHFSGERWQASAAFPDPRYSYLMLSAEGGHPGNDQKQSVILRWIAPGTGTVVVRGELHHPQSQGDGIRARVFSSRLGMLSDWPSFNNRVDTTITRFDVLAGDHLDFIVDCKENPAYDSYHWKLQVRATRSTEGNLVRGTVWDATQDFQSASLKQIPAKQLDPWVLLSQAILASNEFAFVD